MSLFRAFAFILIACLMAGCSQKKQAPQSVQDSPYFLPHDKIVSVDGIDVRYRDEGPRTGNALVMVHGFTSSLETWDALAENLKDDHRLFSLDLPGHGLTGPDPKARYTNTDTVLFLENFLDEINVEAPVLIGNSLGGLVSWRLAAVSAGSVSKLVLISPGGFSINGVTDEPIEVPMMVKLYLTNAPEASVKQATTALFADSSKLSDARVQEVRDMMLQDGNGEAFVQRAATFTLPDPSQDLAKVIVPTLIIWGDKDMMVPVGHAQKFTAAMPKTQLMIYENTGHVPQEETAMRLARDIRKFILEQE